MALTSSCVSCTLLVLYTVLQCSGEVGASRYRLTSVTSHILEEVDIHPHLVRRNRQLNDHRVQQIQSWAASDGLVAWTLGNSGWRDFTYNWVASAKKAGIQNYFVACMDERLFLDLQGRGIPSLLLSSDLGEEEWEWGSKAFKQRGIQKIMLIVDMLEIGLSPVFSDLDSVWLRDPFEYFRSHEAADVLVSTDSCMPHTVELDNCPELVYDPEANLHGLGVMNVGVHLMRPGALPFAKAWAEEMINTGEMEQRCWNAVFRREYDQSPFADEYCRTRNGGVVFGALPAATFMNGESYFNQQSHRVIGTAPYVVHASFIPGRDSKKEHFIENGLWEVDLRSPPQPIVHTTVQ